MHVKLYTNRAINKKKKEEAICPSYLERVNNTQIAFDMLIKRNDRTRIYGHDIFTIFRCIPIGLSFFSEYIYENVCAFVYYEVFDPLDGFNAERVLWNVALSIVNKQSKIEKR